MSKQPLISICIPVYKQLSFLKRLLHSIKTQTFRDFEVIITDDTPDDSIAEFLKRYKNNYPLQYFKNRVALGTPENWNEAIRKASGTWIKMMHGDDWFSSENALQRFADAANNNSARFIFSAYENVSQTTGEKETHQLNFITKWLIKKSELNLFKANYIGNPSCTLIKRDVGLFYDNRLKWVVDFEYYMRFFGLEHSFIYIDKALINVGIHPEQVTGYTFRRPEVELPENHLLVAKMGILILRNVFVYDYYWRLYRNLGIRNVEEIKKYDEKEMPQPLKGMIAQQKKIPLSILRIGAISKVLMILSYLQFRFS